jgi:membrane protein DedA with SNARE-associated domain
MSDTTQFFANHGCLLLFGAVFVDQIGVPVPSVPWLVAAGALIGSGKLSLFPAIVVTVVACLLADLIWFYLGRRKGHGLLRLLCRISLEPDSCVRRTGDMFGRHGMRGVLLAKFVPGLSTVMPPLAGMFGVRTGPFIFFDGMGSLLYGGCFILIGMLFSNQLEQIGRAHV